MIKITNRKEFEQILEKTAASIDRNHLVYTVNMEFLYWARKNEFYRDVLNSGVTTIDSAWVRRMLSLKYGRSFDQVAGSMFVTDVIRFSCVNGLRLLVIGGDRVLHDRLREVLSAREKEWNCKLDLHFFDPGVIRQFPDPNDPEVLSVREEILRVRPRIVLVALGPPKQEILIYHVRDALVEAEVGFVAGIGGALKMVAGLERPAPGWVRRLMLEWLYRFLQDPRGRMGKIKRSLIVLPCAFWEALRYRLSHRS